MSYYMGDFYPRGDPGIGSFFLGLAKRATSMIPVVGPSISELIPAGGRAVGRVAASPAAAGITAVAGSAVKTVKSAIVKHPVLSAAGAAGAIGTMAGAGAEMVMRGGARGGRVLKHCHMPLKSGKLGKCHRSMNVCNPRALRRAIRRTRGFAKLAMRTIHIVHPKKKGRFGGFKKRKRS